MMDEYGNNICRVLGRALMEMANLGEDAGWKDAADALEKNQGGGFPPMSEEEDNAARQLEERRRAAYAAMKAEACPQELTEAEQRSRERIMAGISGLDF